MIPFSPIAIVGQSCVLPGANHPDALWDLVAAGRSAITPVPPGRWGVDPRDVAARGTSAAEAIDGSWSTAGGRVEGFSSLFDPSGFRVSEARIRPLDPLFHLVLHGAREALADARLAEDARARTGLVLGNLSYPSEGMNAYGEAVLLDSLEIPQARARALRDLPDARNRFMSGLPAHLAAEALGLGGAAFSLDAACASALYAIKLACDALQSGRADAMIAGAVNRADDLFLHIGFCALQALSKTGQSRPFHRGADGLLPAEGAAFVVLRRLEDALAGDAPILGVIRGVGLSNDGRGAGLLTPSQEGQVRALQAAYQQAGLSPESVQLLECHATGTPVGDRTELASVRELWRDAPVRLGSLKANLGHLITAAGLAGLLKVLGGMRRGLLPPMPAVDAPLDAVSGAFRLVEEVEPWEAAVRRAGVNAFGFGGNNAHLIVEQSSEIHFVPATPQAHEPLAIVGLGIVAGDADGRAAFSSALFHNQPGATHTESSRLALADLKFPPADLAQTLGQQRLLLQAAREAVANTAALPRTRTGIFAGMGTDPEIVRYGLRWRLPALVGGWGTAASEATWISAARESIQPALSAAGVVGAMPNIVANRLNSQLDLAGPSFAVSAEQASGLVALDIACAALRAGELDAALVGAVELADNPVHAAACSALGLAGPQGDAAVVLVVRRLADATRDGDRVLALIDDVTGVVHADRLRDSIDLSGPLTRRFGQPHAATGLLQVAATALAVFHGAQPGDVSSDEVQPWLTRGGEPRRAQVAVSALGGQSRMVTLRSAGPAVAFQPERARLLQVYAAADRAGLLDAVAADRGGGEGTVRLAIAATTAPLRALLRERAAAAISAGRTPWGDGIYFAEGPFPGELAFLFTGSAGPYPGMGSALMTAFPQTVEALAQRVEDMPDVAWPALGLSRSREPASQMLLSSFLAQLHAVFTRQVLGLKPTASVGYSLGESNALHALGAWSALTPMMREILVNPLFTSDLAGEGHAIRQAWRRRGFPEADEPGSIWENWTVRASRAAVEAAATEIPLVHVLLVNAPDECVIGGHPEALKRLLAALGAPAAPLEYALAVHCPEVREVEAAWRAYHDRPVSEVPSVRFYSAAFNDAYAAAPDRIAEALIGHGVDTLDFPRLVERAWADGVRIFVEHGPRSLCAGWVRRTLGDRPHLAVSLDAPDRPGLLPVAEAVAQLWAAGVEISAEGLSAFLAEDVRADSGMMLVQPAHGAPVAVPPLPATPEVQAPAPALPRISPEEEAPEPPEPVAEIADDEPERAEPGPVPEVPAAAPHPAMAALLDGVAQLTEVHRQFLAHQAASETAFLQWRAGVPVVAGPESEAPAAPPPPAAAERAHPGPSFSREDLEFMATGPLSERFGPLFQRQDGYARQVRMPAPPLLLADRVTGIDATPGEMKPGTIWTETDVRWDSWYLHQGTMPPGIMIESGQADLLLCSWMGADFLNQGERVYRLLGCALSWHGTPPRPGETLCYTISIDGFAQHGDVRLFFFRYDCTVDGQLRLRVRGGQAGFFTNEELADSAGVVWDPETGEHAADARVDAPEVVCEKTAFSRAELDAFAAGDLVGCFGPAFAYSQTHVRTPRVAGGRLLLLDRVTAWSTTGGPWGRGYLRAEQDLSPESWFFAGHFHNDPCMPGTLMFDGCVSAMAIYLTALGVTLKRDGARFQTVRDLVYPMVCRGQAIPSSRRVVYEVFVEEFHAGPRPVLYADVRVSVDGLAAFHCRRLGVELVADWPLTDRPDLLLEAGRDPNAGLPETPSETPFDYFALLSCAWGRNSDAFGPDYVRFNEGKRGPRLPGPPYHFMSRVRSVGAPSGQMQTGVSAELDYDVPPDAWYFEEGQGAMPFSVLLEVALQPCGWLATWVGCALQEDEEVFFRNLDGEGRLYATVTPDTGTLTTHTTLTRLSRFGGMTLVNFDVTLSSAAGPVFVLQTGFGFFPAGALASQAGLPFSPEEKAWTEEAPQRLVTLSRPPQAPTALQQGPGGMPWGRIGMLDRVTGLWPEGGAAGKGRIRADLVVEPSAWFFKAHFFQDPVQPGSLGIEAMFGALRAWGLLTGHFSADQRLVSRLHAPLHTPLSWTYRGQVRPHNQRVVIELDITETGIDAHGPWAVGDAALWVDGIRIYAARGLGLAAAP